MEPRIQYARTSDGVNIAYWSEGDGPALINMPGAPSSHIELECSDPDFQQWYRRQLRTHRVVRYDPRGTGLSDRDATDLSLDAWVRDLAAVIESLQLEQVALTGICFSGPPAIAYAAHHPERVSHLILWCTYAVAADAREPQFDALLNLVDMDWELFSETMAHAMVAGWTEGDRARRFARLFREGITPSAFQAQSPLWQDVDVTDLLPRVQAATHVIHRRDVGWPSMVGSTRLAAGIPGAQLHVLDGSSVLPFIGDMEAVAQLIDEILGVEARVERVRGPAGGFATILFTDIESSSALAQRQGDAKAHEVRRAHDAIVREALAAHGGSEIKHTGDGIMASFVTASSALQCATAIQRGVAAHREERPELPLAVYVGVNAGEPIAEDADLFGTSVDLARRLVDEAEPNQILVSDVVRQLAAGKGFLFSDRGDVLPKGFEEPVRLHELRWQE